MSRMGAAGGAECGNIKEAGSGIISDVTFSSWLCKQGRTAISQSTNEKEKTNGYSIRFKGARRVPQRAVRQRERHRQLQQVQRRQPRPERQARRADRQDVPQFRHGVEEQRGPDGAPEGARQDVPP